MHRHLRFIDVTSHERAQTETTQVSHGHDVEYEPYVENVARTVLR